MKKLIFIILLSSFISNSSICQQSHVNVGIVCSRLNSIQDIKSCIELATNITNHEKTKYDPISWQFAAELYYNLLKKQSDSLNLSLAELANLSFNAALNSLSLNISQNNRTVVDSIDCGKINEIIFGLHDRKFDFDKILIFS